MRRLPALVFVTAAAAGLAGCSNGAAPAGSSEPAGKNPAGKNSVTSTSPTPAKKTAPRVRTAAVLRKALLARADLPKGFAVDPEDKNTVTLRARGDGCTALVTLMNADKPPGARTIAKRTLVYNKALPVVSEELDAMGTAKAAAALQKRLRSAVASCKTVTLIDSGKAAPLSVRPVPAAPVGKNPAAVQFTVTGGELKGLVLTFVTAAVDDVLVAITFVGAAHADITGGTVLAVNKVKEALGAKPPA